MDKHNIATRVSDRCSTDVNLWFIFILDGALIKEKYICAYRLNTIPTYVDRQINRITLVTPPMIVLRTKRKKKKKYSAGKLWFHFAIIEEHNTGIWLWCTQAFYMKWVKQNRFDEHSTHAGRHIASLLQWHHNEWDGVPLHRCLHCLFNRLFRLRSKKKNQSSATLTFFRWIHRCQVDSLHKGPLTRKMFPFHDVIMLFRKTKEDIGWLWSSVANSPVW